MFIVYVGADHRGFNLKENIKAVALALGYEVADCGNEKYDENDDYPDFAAAVAKKVSLDPENARGILACGSGAGVDIVANKFLSVRSVLGMSPDHVYDARHDDNVNVLSIAADFVDETQIEPMVKTFLATAYAGGGRFERRLKKIESIELKIKGE
ncbi:MAG: RpiB/LacA/LacB family sugar-phosphate isomerase [bacterium]|nr:RpiB/LacA/LacB family sugar-phosphate isomerase [bacterium]